MRAVSLGRPNSGATKDTTEQAFRDWVQQCMAEIERASYDDIVIVANDYTLTNNSTKQRTLDATAGTLADVRLVLSTFIDDIKKRGMKRSQ